MAEGHRMLIFTSCLLLSFLLIFSFLCFSSRADLNEDIKSFDFHLSGQVLFGSLNSDNKKILNKNAQDSQMFFDFEEVEVAPLKSKPAAKLASNDAEGMDVFITVSSIGLKWENIW